MKNNKKVSIVGAGLAGGEAALQLADNGYKVTLYDSKPNRLLDVYAYSTYAELVCNNSLGKKSADSPMGLLLKELNLFGSKLLKIAEEFEIKDPNYFAIDKHGFSKKVTEEMHKKNIIINDTYVEQIPNDDNIIIATGPLTNNKIIEDLSVKYGVVDYHFFDASSPVVDIKSIDLSNENIVKISEDLYAVNIPLTTFKVFFGELIKQSIYISKHTIDKTFDFDKCESIEQIAQKGINELYLKRFCNLNMKKPCLLLRRESAFGDAFILVGCMTTLKHNSQVKVFSLLPGFEEIKFIKYGRMHRNTFFNSPKFLNEFFQIKETNTYIVGQISGIDGYAPAIASGMVAAMHIIYGDSMPVIPTNTMVGGLCKYVSNDNVVDFQPMCASFSLLTSSKSESLDTVKNYLEILARKSRTSNNSV